MLSEILKSRNRYFVVKIQYLQATFLEGKKEIILIVRYIYVHHFPFGEASKKDVTDNRKWLLKCSNILK